MPQPKYARESMTVMTEMVLPNDTNTLNNLMGGRLLHFMDIAAAIAAQKHSNRIVVTASVDNVSFAEPIRLGNIVTMKAQVTRAFSSSMEVFIEVWARIYRPVFGTVPTARSIRLSPWTRLAVLLKCPPFCPKQTKKKTATPAHCVDASYG
jgi:acyl-CoA hydrolase